MSNYGEIRELLDRVRRRWRTLRALEAVVRAALMASVPIGLALIAARYWVVLPRH